MSVLLFIYLFLLLLLLLGESNTVKLKNQLAFFKGPTAKNL